MGKKNPTQTVLFGLGNKQTITTYGDTVINFRGTKEQAKDILLFQSNPSDISTVVLELYKAIEDDEIHNEYLRKTHPNTESKIAFNNIRTKKQFIETLYTENSGYLQMAYSALEDDQPGRKKKFMRFLNYTYIRIKGEYTARNSEKGEMDIVREFADAIITKIYTELYAKFNHLRITHISKEDIEIGLWIIICDAIVDCKVLENPYNHDIS